MKDQYIIAEKRKDFVRVYDEYLCVTGSLSLEEAKGSQERFNKVSKRKVKIFKLVEVK